MEFDGCVNNKSEDTDNIIWLDEESTGPENDDFSDFYNQRNSKSGGSYGRNTARSFWGRGYGPAGPPNQQSFPRGNYTEKFLLRCGVQKPTLKGLPKVVLRLMEPEYCGVCAHVFDNFDGARLHYVSKNHSKNLKKWLAQQAKVGYKRPKEIPLRARELYCELCDIHITSKAHADSHYAGKPHRAIVEGRKIPKNPFLLQKNMHGRLQQLIRREKRSLKPTEKPAASEIAKTVPRPIPSELYCDICKASVTCTEQMTMHLNGKKHLSKEKRHIFKMMKGETTIQNKIKKKCKYLRDQFSSEHAKIPISRSGDGASTSYEPKWSYYKSLLFLKDIIKTRKSSRNLTKSKRPLSRTTSVESVDQTNDANDVQDDSNFDEDNLNQDDSNPDQVSTSTELPRESYSVSRKKKNNTFNQNMLDIER